MRITALTIFPQIFDSFVNESILGRARRQGLIEFEAVDLRPFSERKHKNTDDDPFGGGAGMVMLAQPVVDAMESVATPGCRRVYLSPRGQTLTQKKAEEYAKLDHLILLCGHYEGLDQRTINLCVDEDLSIGDYVLTGGETAAMVVLDAVSRLVPGVLGNDESPEDESFTSGLLEYPQYTRPREYRGMSVPEVLLNGNHAEIVKWRRAQALRVTFERRPEMLETAVLTAKERALVREWQAEKE